MLKKECLLVVLLAAMIGGTRSASAQLGAELNAAHSEERWGSEIGIGYAIRFFRGFRITPGIGLFLHSGNNNSNYYEDNNGGDPRCRDSSNGRYADTNLCSNLAASIYGKFEAGYSVSKKVRLGAGVRLAGTTDLYGTIDYAAEKKSRFYANGGPAYYAFGVRFGF